ncbi:hypothetical protein [Psychrobacter sp. I-STPA10]|uniref:hypothetical protein n=1 Tax=Psychrobacter sp. I-STPA10 TaxID=2585769 RepID=UPI001E498888|nr:hypothetical protein [Psychrobacter sp. I-STPA10]
MPDRLKSILEGSNSENGSSQLIMNAEDYAQRVLLQGKAIPWHDATAYANHLGQTAALLKPQVSVISIDKMIEQELADNSKLTAAMGEKKRAGYALRTFMGNEDFKAAAGSLVTSTVKTQRVPVLVQMPSPLQLLYLTAQAAQPDAEHEFDNDAAENAAIYCADWLRAFKDAGIAGLIFDERAGEVAKEAYQPINNMAEHYLWPVGVRRDNEVIFTNPDVTIPVLDTEYWTTGDNSSEVSGVAFTEIARDAVPEQVLEFREKLS